MHLIDDQVFQRRLQLPDLSPVEVILHNPGMVFKVLAVLRPLSPVALACHGFRIRIQKYLVLVEKLPLCSVIRPVQLKRVFKLLDFNSEYKYGVCVPDMIGVREFQPCIGLRLLWMVQEQRTFRGSSGMDGEAHPARCARSAVPVVESRPDLEAAYLIQGLQLHTPLGS